MPATSSQSVSFKLPLPDLLKVLFIVCYTSFGGKLFLQRDGNLNEELL